MTFRFVQRGKIRKGDTRTSSSEGQCGGLRNIPQPAADQNGLSFKTLVYRHVVSMFSDINLPIPNATVFIEGTLKNFLLEGVFLYFRLIDFDSQPWTSIG